jgi:uncharacterized protein
MSDRDEQEPIRREDLSAEESTGTDVSGANPAVADSFAEPPAFVLPAVPIAPPKAINAPASRALAFGDDLIDFASDSTAPMPPRLEHLNSAPRGPLPGVLASEHFPQLYPDLYSEAQPANEPNPDGPNPPIGQRRPASARGDQLTEALRPESSASDAAAASEQYSAPDFPITPFTPFAAPRHAEASGEESPAPDAPDSQVESAINPGLAGAPSFPRALLRENAEAVEDQQPQINPIPDARYPIPSTRYPTPDTRYPIPDTQPESRIPNFGHLLLLAVIALFGLVASGLAVRFALQAHLWGISTADKALVDIHYTLASMAVLYVVSFIGAFFLFPLLWHKPFFAGLQWNLPAAVRYRHWLFGAAFFCFILALVDQFLLPGPENAPIDKMFSNSAAAWLLFAFGVTVAPFFEEIAFRGFLLPALCTAVDWAIALRTKEPPLPLGPNGHPQWSLPAMIVGSILTSLPFAAMHADQIAHSIGPLVLLFCVSLILCAARLATRSLAASTLVHASYNFILFALMLVGTGGFKHLDKM